MRDPATRLFSVCVPSNDPLMLCLRRRDCFVRGRRVSTRTVRPSVPKSVGPASRTLFASVPHLASHAARRCRLGLGRSSGTQGHFGDPTPFHLRPARPERELEDQSPTRLPQHSIPRSKGNWMPSGPMHRTTDVAAGPVAEDRPGKRPFQNPALEASSGYGSVCRRSALGHARTLNRGPAQPSGRPAKDRYESRGDAGGGRCLTVRKQSGRARPAAS